MEQKYEIRRIYDDQFKHQVISEYLETKCSKMSLLRKYDIHSKSAVQRWMKKYGYQDIYQEKINKFAITNTSMARNKQGEDIRDLQLKITLLEKQLEIEKLRSKAYARVIEIAEQELKIPLRKKYNTK
jgi:transposase-like protein